MIDVILRRYKILVDFLGQTLGPDYEVVLQDLTDGKNEIVAIANGHVSGRTIGSPLTNTALQLITSRQYETNDFVCNYKGITEEGKVLRSSTMFIKDKDNMPIGLLCINFDDSRYRELSRQLEHILHPESFAMSSFTVPKTGLADGSTTAYETTSSMTESFPMDIPALMEKIFTDCTSALSMPANRLNQTERKAIMLQLNEQGMFQLKGSIPFVAKKFACSTASVYRYLSEISNK